MLFGHTSTILWRMRSQSLSGIHVTTKSGLYYDLIQRKDGATGVEKVSGVKRPKLDVGR